MRGFACFSLFVGLLLFFAARAFLYFRNGRAFAGTFAALACLLFVGGIYADYAKYSKASAGSARSAV